MDVIRKSLKYFKKFMPTFFFALTLGLVNIVLLQLMPQIIQLLLDYCIMPSLGGSVATDKNMFYFLIAGSSGLWQSVLILAIAYLVMAAMRHVFHYLRWTSSHHGSLQGEKRLRHAAFKKVITQNTNVLNRYTSGELMSITNSDPVMVKDIFQHFFPLSIEHFFCVIMATVFIMFIDPFLAIIPGCCGLLMAAVATRYMKSMEAVYSDIRASSVELNTCVQENINGVRIVRSFASETLEMKKFNKYNEKYRGRFITHSKVWSRYQAIFQSLSQINIVGSTALAIMFCIDGRISIGQFATIGTYINLIASPLLNISTWLSQLQQAVVAGTRLYTFLETDNIIKDVAEPSSITEKPNLAMRAMSLIIDEQPILTDIDLELPYGKKLGIMGKTGSGKSALLKTMSRMFEATMGEININRVNLKQIKLEDVRRQFGWVMQDVFLFSNTVDANIALYNPDAPKDEVLEAARVAQADGFVNKLIDGYSTVVGERGLGLSGGQKQRISIARALMKHAPILILDDATSALDLETEHKIFDALKQDYSEISIVISAHRASSVEWCDEIIFLENGRIAERGTHKELLALDGKYAEVYRSQKVAREEVLS